MVRQGVHDLDFGRHSSCVTSDADPELPSKVSAGESERLITQGPWVDTIDSQKIRGQVGAGPAVHREGAVPCLEDLHIAE